MLQSSEMDPWQDDFDGYPVQISDFLRVPNGAKQFVKLFGLDKNFLREDDLKYNV